MMWIPKQFTVTEKIMNFCFSNTSLWNRTLSSSTDNADRTIRPRKKRESIGDGAIRPPFHINLCVSQSVSLPLFLSLLILNTQSYALGLGTEYHSCLPAAITADIPTQSAMPSYKWPASTLPPPLCPQWEFPATWRHGNQVCTCTQKEAGMALIDRFGGGTNCFPSSLTDAGVSPSKGNYSHRFVVSR